MSPEPGTERPTLQADAEAETSPSDPLAETIRDALKRRDGAALGHQRTNFSFAVFTAVLGPLAVILLTIQALVYPDGGTFAVLLISGELLTLALALSLGFLGIGRSHTLWIRERLRAELLRRELFLLRMRVGPYLNEARPSESFVAQRLLVLDSDAGDPVDSLVMADDVSGNWRDALESAWRHGSPTPIDCLPTCLTDYRQKRVAEQRGWFSRRSESHHRSSRLWENAAKMVLVLALVLSALHLGLLLEAPAEARHAGHGTRVLHTALLLVAIVLPAIGAALVGFHSILGSHRLTRAYRYNAKLLEQIECELRALEHEIAAAATPTDDMVFMAKRLVLKAEEVASDDLRQWWLITKADAPRAGA